MYWCIGKARMDNFFFSVLINVKRIFVKDFGVFVELNVPNAGYQ